MLLHHDLIAGRTNAAKPVAHLPAVEFARVCGGDAHSSPRNFNRLCKGKWEMVIHLILTSFMLWQGSGYSKQANQGKTNKEFPSRVGCSTKAHEQRPGSPLACQNKEQGGTQVPFPALACSTAVFRLLCSLYRVTLARLFLEKRSQFIFFQTPLQDIHEIQCSWELFLDAFTPSFPSAQRYAAAVAELWVLG